MASQENLFFKSLMMPGNREVALDAETIRELIDLTSSFPEGDMIGIKNFYSLSDNI
jgi:hypothetical protein